MTTSLPPDLSRWLETVTQQLPAQAAAYTRDELTAHYEDALADYLAAGLTPDEAHAQAMADLGEGDVVSRGLKDAHLGYRRYQWAMLASFSMLIFMLGFPIIYLALGLKEDSSQAIGLYVVDDILFYGLTTFVLLSARQLFTWRFHLPLADRFIRLSVGGLTLQIIADISSVLLFGYSHNVGNKFVTIFQTGSGLEAGLHLVSLIGFVIIGVGLLGLAREILKNKTDLYGLGPPLAVLLIVMGGCFFSSWLWLNIPSAISQLVGVLVLLSHFLIWPLLTLLFFRVLYRPTGHPIRLA
ncbi:MAG: hypothetical protein JW953_03970 [Anaerolineae bacterium]|nr:hypothetical protein [Anaerolineae bacterium]